MDNLFEYISIIKDPRGEKGKLHKLEDVIIMSIYGILCGCQDAVEISYFLEVKEEYFKNLLNLKHGTPSHDTISYVFRIIDPKEFMEMFSNWIKEVIKKKGKRIAIDGKAVKSATDKINKGNTPYVVSAFLTDIGISIGQVKVNEKSNEIKAIPELIELIDIKDTVITTDALGTQKDIVNKIRSKKGHYVLSVKENQGKLFQDIEDHFKVALKDKEMRDYINEYVTTTKDHGRIEKREYFFTTNLKYIYSKDDWKDLKTIGMVKQTREINDKKSINIKYYISDLDLPTREFENITRSHWQIENGLHWILDVHFKEDLSRNRKDYSIHNFSLVRKICYNLTKLDKTFGEVPIKRKIMRYTHDFTNLERLIFQILPSID